MGKKSRKKATQQQGSKKSATSHRERLQERRGRQQETRLQAEQDAYEYIRPYFVGDRVFFYERLGHCRLEHGAENTSNTYRGIVQKVHDGHLDILPIHWKEHGSADTLPTPISSVFPDFKDMTLRFKIGDRVVCSSGGGWKTATVKCLWAIDEVREFPKRASDLVPHYKCDRDDPTGRWPCLAAPFDNDKCIMRMPDKVRFAVGEKIIFDLYESATAASSGLRTFDAAGFPQWIEATVTKAAFIDTNQGYLSYEVEFDVGQTKSGVQKMYRCVVFDDNDKHICSANANPRKRLFDAIEQDCDSDHLDYLSSTFKIDIITIRDLVISHAIEFCSYKALNWLHNDCNIDVLHMKDSSGNNLLHRIASMPNAVRFIKEAGRLSCLDEDEGPESKLELGTFRNDLTNQLNNNSETWLQILVKRNDGRALDIALSPNNGMAWELSYECALSEENVSSLRDCIQESNNTIMECLLDSFIDFRSLLQQHRTFTFVSSQTEEELFGRKELAGYRNDGDHKAKVLTRFVHDYQGICPRYGPTSSALLRQYYGIVMNGLGSFFQYFYKADRNCFRNETFIVTNRADQNE